MVTRRAHGTEGTETGRIGSSDGTRTAGPGGGKTEVRKPRESGRWDTVSFVGRRQGEGVCGSGVRTEVLQEVFRGGKSLSTGFVSRGYPVTDEW